MREPSGNSASTRPAAETAAFSADFADAARRTKDPRLLTARTLQLSLFGASGYATLMGRLATPSWLGARPRPGLRRSYWSEGARTPLSAQCQAAPSSMWP
jgi:hypothetical protein